MHTTRLHLASLCCTLLCSATPALADAPPLAGAAATTAAAAPVAAAQAPAPTDAAVPKSGAAAAKPATPAALAVPRGSTALTWLAHSAFLLTTSAGTNVLIDPWLDSPKAPANVQLPDHLDAILVTHGHYDHLGSAAELARKTGAVVIGAYELVALLDLPKAQALGFNIGGTLVVKDVTIHLVEALHSSSIAKPGQPAHYSGSPMGFVVASKDGPTFYHAGDTDVFAGMQLIGRRYHPTIALLPIGGLFTMDPQGAALASQLLGVRTVVPMHYGTYDMLPGTPEQLAHALGRRAKMVAFTPGERKTFTTKS